MQRQSTMGLRTRHITPYHAAAFLAPKSNKVNFEMGQTKSNFVQTWVQQSQTRVKHHVKQSQILWRMTLFAGLAVGGEFGSCIVYLYEIAPKRKRGLFSSFGQASIVSVHECHVPFANHSTAGSGAAVAVGCCCSR
jgi:MFS-type transporter involved in bile tolerance (Atg22 family)